MQQPVRLCPRAAPTAFAEYRLAGAALRLSPRGDLRTGDAWQRVDNCEHVLARVGPLSCNSPAATRLDRP